MAAIAADPETYRRHYEHDPAETKRLAEEIKRRINIRGSITPVSRLGM
jgi:hypothetical protein